jgi:hypothetical protein
VTLLQCREEEALATTREIERRGGSPRIFVAATKWTAVSAKAD